MGTVGRKKVNLDYDKPVSNKIETTNKGVRVGEFYSWDT